MPTVLIELPGGGGIVRRADGQVVIASDVTCEDGRLLPGLNDYRPVRVRLDRDRWIVAGRLPPSAVNAEVVDERGAHVAAATGSGVYAAVVNSLTKGLAPIVCCRDSSGAPVPRPLPAEWPRTRVVDAQDPCPACGATDYDEVSAIDGSRGGRGGHGHDGPLEPNRIVVCRRCGHEEGAGTELSRFTSADTEDETARAARIARHRAEARMRKYHLDAMTLRGVTFPVYAAEGWQISIGASESRGDVVSKLTVGHSAEQSADSSAAPAFTVTTATQNHCEGERDEPRRVLETWLHTNENRPEPDSLSDAAAKLWFAARERERQRAVSTAVSGERKILIDGQPQMFLTLGIDAGPWVGWCNHRGLLVTIAANRVDPVMCGLNPISDLEARLLGPEAP